MYINCEWYTEEFKGKKVPLDDFEHLAEMASDVIDSICTVSIDEETAKSNLVKKATAYEVELLFSQGGVDAVTGGHDNPVVASESLGDYSVSYVNNNTSQQLMRTEDGIPVSPLAVPLLRRAGLMHRWAYAERGRNNAK